ncbi:MAG: hypothetical protein COB39_12705 [Marinosulfonomonas sp.]|nr:MAG: hypothetical protein COB39_12705 [Marinosulfonomonas sp.]
MRLKFRQTMACPKMKHLREQIGLLVAADNKPAQNLYLKGNFHATGMVIIPFLTGYRRRTYAAILSFWAGVMLPMPILGRSLL